MQILCLLQIVSISSEEGQSLAEDSEIINSEALSIVAAGVVLSTLPRPNLL